ncbi:ComF family protein [Aureimonas leprariae]|uniref:ComF family protein n=1 Tax=Plantimonas leprariae TaxID=2615207 RepID=A0A7V7TV76_9HYPH|nr:ComF family protein [Aureimonas leprariae]KAB0677064.1 ComF family protein [Aureimonas leprariae]
MASFWDGTGRLPGLRRAAEAVGQVLFPPVCPLCRAATAAAHALCPACWTKLAFIEPPFCAVLGTPFARDFGEGALSPEAIAAPPRFSRLRAAVLYGDTSARLASALKYADRTELAPMLAGWMRRAGAELLAEADLVVPVPLHRLRLFTRRYNQSAELARRVAAASRVPYAPLALARTRWTRRQVGLGRDARRRNVSRAFRVPDEWRARLAGRRVVLVDDVFTTGATVDAATAALLKAGAAAVDVLVFARVAAGG